MMMISVVQRLLVWPFFYNDNTTKVYNNNNNKHVRASQRIMCANWCKIQQIPFVVFVTLTLTQTLTRNEATGRV